MLAGGSNITPNLPNIAGEVDHHKASHPGPALVPSKRNSWTFIGHIDPIGCWTPTWKTAWFVRGPIVFLITGPCYDPLLMSVGSTKPHPILLSHHQAPPYSSGAWSPHAKTKEKKHVFCLVQWLHREGHPGQHFPLAQRGLVACHLSEARDGS